MTIQVRPITRRESEILYRWQRLNDIARYRRARILRLSQEKYPCPMIAEALVLHVETVRQVIDAFNKGGIPAITQGLFGAYAHTGIQKTTKRPAEPRPFESIGTKATSIVTRLEHCEDTMGAEI